MKLFHLAYSSQPKKKKKSLEIGYFDNKLNFFECYEWI